MSEYDLEEIRKLLSTLKKKKPNTYNKEIEKGFGKKKKKKTITLENEEIKEKEDNDDYSYQELLTRVFNILRENNQDVSGESR
jgi:hypothetical protein